MSKMRKSLAVLSSAIAPIVFACSSASAGLTLSLRSATADWPNSSNSNAAPRIDSGSSSTTPAAGPNSGTTAYTFVPGDVLAETFTTGSSGFSLGAISLVAGGGGPTDTTNGASIHLFQLNSSYTPSSGGYNLGNAAEVGNDLLGGGAGLTFNLRSSANSIYEFDFTGTDQVALQPNTAYAIELWSSSDNAPQTYFQSTTGQTYAGGQEYANDATNYPANQVDHSTVTRGQVTTSGPQNLLFAVYANTNVIPGPAFWNNTASGSWDTGSNWSTQTAPNGIGVEADFLSSSSTVNATYSTRNGLTTPGNVYTDTAKTLGVMYFDNANGYVIDGAGSLTLQVATGSAAVNVISGVQEINVPLTIASNTSFNVSSGATLKISDPVVINTGTSLTSNAGVGTVAYQSTVTVNGSGNITFAAPTTVHALTLAGATSTAVVSNHGAGAVNLLQLDALGTVAGSKLDLTNNAAILHGGPMLSVASQLTTAFTDLQAGYNKGNWNGSGGIVSSTAAGNSTHLTTLGFMQSTGSTFDGVNTTTSDVLIKYTYVGDANLDGSVNGADYQQIDAGYGSHLTGWQNGDFNYDGVVDGSDFSLIDNAFNQTHASGSAPLAIIATPSALIGSAAVPEPATLGLLSIGALGLLGRRRRSI